MAFQPINPADGTVVAIFDEMGDEELRTALQTAEDCYRHGWRLRTVADRAQILRKAAQALRDNADEYAGYVTREMGKLAGEARYEIELSAAILDYYATWGPDFLRPQPIEDAPSAKVVTEPLGVILAIEPRNFPCHQLA